VVDASFAVLSASNDDYSESRFIREVVNRIARSPHKNSEFFGALCPSREPWNDARRILRTPRFRVYEIHLMLLKCKLDSHAELRTAEIEDYLSGPNVVFHVIDADRNASSDDERRRAKESQIRGLLQ
jgi:hypothetical protein